MALTLILVLLRLILIGLIGLLTFKIYQITKKFDKLYNYFIRSENDEVSKKINFGSFMKGLPPTNGECPTKEELDSLE